MKLPFFLLTALCVNSLFAANVTDWRGKDRLGNFPESNLQQSWPKDGPKVLWKNSEVGAGYSSVTVIGEKIFATGIKKVDNKEVELLSCLDQNGKILWQTIYGNAWTGQYPSARTTPTYRDGHLYLVSGHGEVVNVNSTDGKILWKVEAKKLYGGKNGMWGSAESPVVDDKAVYFLAGGENTTMVALSCKDGSLLWKSDSLKDNASYVTPTMVTCVNNKKLLVGATVNYIFGIDPEDGKIMWSTNFVEVLQGDRKINRWDITANSIVYYDDKLILSNGYELGTIAYVLAPDGTDIKQVWKNLDTNSLHHGFAIFDNHIFTAGKNSFSVVETNKGKTLFKKKVGNVGNA
ncbi:MAG: PQQ-binding-like beta-propeller repeat protein, partial [Lentisphaeria bacterium]